MTEVDINFGYGPVRAIDIAALVSGNVVISGPARLFGWSVRETGTENSQANEGNVVAPAAGAVIVQLAAIPAGTYTVAWTVELQGAAAAADANNFGLYAGATLLEQSVNAGAAGVYQQDTVVQPDLFGAAFAVKAIGAGTAGVTYSAQISITPNVEYGAACELRDGNSALAEIAVGVQLGGTKWFGPSGIRIFNQVKAVMAGGVLSGAVYIAYQRE